MGKNTPAVNEQEENQPGVVDIDNEDFGGSRVDDTDDQDMDLGNDVLDDEIDNDDSPEPEPEPKPSKRESKKDDDKNKKDADSDDGGDDSDSDDDEADDAKPAKKDADKADDADSADAEEADDPDADDENSTRRVPVSRLNKEIDKRRKLEQELERLRQNSDRPEQEIQKPREGDQNRKSDDEETRLKQEELDAELEKELGGAFEEMLDGDTSKATKAVMQAIKKNREESQRLAEQTSQQVYQRENAQDRTKQELMDTATKIVSEYPELNAEDQETFNPDIFDEVLELRDAYINSGTAPAAALRKSADLVMKAYGVKPASQQEPEPAPADKKPAAKDPKTIEDKLRKRAAQPPRTEGENDRGHEKTAVTEMSETDFDNLTKEELARLRGDII